MSDPSPSPEKTQEGGPDPALEIGLLALVFTAIGFWGGANAAFVAGHFLAALALAAFFFLRPLVTGRLVLPLPLPLLAIAAVLGMGAFQAESGLSVARDETRETLLRYGAAAIVFVLACAAARSGRSRARLALGIAALVFLEASYGIIEHQSGHEHILLWPKETPGSVSGTFKNRNHFAGVLALGTPVALAVALLQPVAWPSTLPSLRTKLVLAADDPGFWKRAFLLAAAVLGTLATFLSLSRGGTLAFVVAVGTFGAVSARSRRARAATLGALLVLVLASALLLYLYGANGLIHRFEDIRAETDSPDARLAFAKATLALIAERPLTGFGLGAYEQAQTHVQATWLQGARLTHAHCDWLELPAEVGLPLAAFAVGTTLLAAFLAWRKAAARGPALLENALLAAVAAAAAHALFDFDLELEGPLVLSAFLLGLLVGGEGRALVLRGSGARLAGTGLALALAALAPFPATVLRAELLAHPTVRLVDDDRPPAERLRALERAIELRPDRASYRIEAAPVRLDAFERELDRGAAEAALNLGGEHPPETLVRSLRATLRVSRADEERAAATRSLEDVRAALASEPGNARALAKVAFLTTDRAEALAASERAVASFPQGVEVLLDAAFARLRFDPEDASARTWLSRALSLEPKLFEWSLAEASLSGLEASLSRALPTLELRRRFATALLVAGRYDLVLPELDTMARLEESASAPPPSDDDRGEKGELPPDGWLDAPRGKPLEASGAPVLKLARPAFAKVSPGTLDIETSVVPGHAPAFVCVIVGGRHAGHVLARDDWSHDSVLLKDGGWVRLELSAPRHGLGPADAVLVRDASLR